jgi:outer membrane protein assembly factor BamB
VEWPNWRGPDYNGISRETEWDPNWGEEGPKKLWKASVGTGFSTVTVAYGRVFTMGNVDDVDIVSCLDANTGKRVWRHQYVCPKDPNNYEGGPSATPTVYDFKVYTLSKQGHLYCLKVPNGQVAWRKNIRRDFGLKAPKWGFASSPLVLHRMLVLNAGAAGIALDARNGKVLWRSAKTQGGYATPVPFQHAGKRYLAIFSRRSLEVVDSQDGRKLCATPWKTKYDVNAADPIISDGKVFISSGYNRGCSLIKIGETPETLWENRNMRNQFSSSVLLGGYLYGFDESTLRCISFETGDVKWSQEGLGKGSLSAADGKLIVLSECLPGSAGPSRYWPGEGYMPAMHSVTSSVWT